MLDRVMGWIRGKPLVDEWRFVGPEALGVIGTPVHFPKMIMNTRTGEYFTDPLELCQCADGPRCKNPACMRRRSIWAEAIMKEKGIEPYL